MKPMTPVELKRVTGTSDQVEQINILKAHGLNPIVDRVTGRPYIYQSAVEKSMMSAGRPAKPKMNTEAFGDGQTAQK